MGRYGAGRFLERPAAGGFRAPGQAAFFVSCYLFSRELFTPRAIWGGMAPTIAAAVASAVGYVLASRMENDWAGIGVGLGIGLGLYFGLMVILDLPSLRRVSRLVGRGVGVAPG